MRIAIHDPGGMEKTEHHIARALRKKGVETSFFQYPKIFWKSFLHTFRPDWILFSSVDVAYRFSNGAQVKKIKEVLPEARIVFWTFDPMQYADRPLWFLALAPRLDVVCMKERQSLNEYRKLGINAHYLDQAAIPETPYGERSDPQWEAEVVFVGSPHRGQAPEKIRVELMKAIRGKYSLKIGSADRADWQALGFRGNVAGRVKEKDWPTLAASAKIVIGIDVKQDCEGYWSNRVYKALGSGCFFLNRYVPGFETIFEAGRHLDWFESKDEAISKIFRYLKDSSARERIRRQGYDLVHSSHTYDHRINEFLAILQSVPMNNQRAVHAK